jgi:polyhydroxybutyrate depolymerase
LVACGGGTVSPPPRPTPAPLLAARPYGLQVPVSYSGTTAAPLVLVLHGYGASGLAQAQYFGLLAGSETHGYLLAYPDGTIDPRGARFWNATDACCNFFASSVDDVAYLTAVLDDVAARYNVDSHRVFVVGHSNGGFMAHRLACEIGDRLAAVVSLAGATWKDPARCPAVSRVNVLQVHGDADETILYGGNAAYPSAEETVASWAHKNSCTGSLQTTGRRLDLDTKLAGAETQEKAYIGCPDVGTVRLWTIEGGHHVPDLDAAWPEALWTYLSSHPKT